MSGNGAREKALQFLREVPRLHRANVRGLPRVAGVETKGRYSKHGRGQQGYDAGWGSSARQKLHFGPLGYEGGSSPIQRKTEFERSYNYGLRFQRQFPPITLGQLQLMIDTNRISTEQPLDMAALCGSKIARIDPQQNHFGFNLTRFEHSRSS
jgi:ribosomal protein L15